MQKPDIESVTYLKDAIAELNRLINQGYLRDDRLEHRVQGIIFDIKDIQDAVLNRINEVDYE